MAKSDKRGRGTPVDTEDRVMASVERASSWAAENQRLVTLGLVAVLALGAIGLIYVNYQQDVRDRAAVRLDEIRMASRGAPPEQIRSELAAYVDQFGSAPQADEARVFLADIELGRGAPDAAIDLLSDVADPAGGPLQYNAAMMLAVAHEQRGDLAEAARLYEQLAREARHDYQRQRARASRARLHTYAGEYAEAEAIYAELAADSTGVETFYGVRLGEVRARAEAGLPAPEVPSLSAPPTGEAAPPAGVEPDSGTAPTADEGVTETDGLDPSE